MSEEGNSERTIDKGSDVFFDYNCSDCIRRRNAYTDALFYCPECHKYLCRQCVACVHDVIGRGNVGRWGKPSTRSEFDPCPIHKGNVMQLYCPNHDSVCCPVCSRTQHKSCSDSVYIPLVANAQDDSAGLLTVQKGISELLSTADKLGKGITTRMSVLEQTEEQLVASVREHRAGIDVRLDCLEEQSIEDIRQFKVVCKDRYMLELAICDNIKTQMSDLTKKLDEAVKDKTLLFSRIKHGKELVQDKNHLMSDMASFEIKDKAHFIPHKEFECVSGLEGLGKLMTDIQIDQPQSIGQGKVQKTECRGQDTEAVLLYMYKPYTVHRKTSVCVKTRDDKETCHIRGMCQLPDGSIIVADNSNRKLKQLDSTYKVISDCSLGSKPWGVCHTQAGQVAVCLYGKAIQFVSVGDTMINRHSFRTVHDCNSLAYSNNCLYVTELGGTTIYVYSLSGTMLHTISADQQGRKLFYITRCITASPDGARLHITDRYQGLVTLDINGRHRSSFRPPELEYGVYAVCTDGDGNVFVGGFRSNSVIQVGQTGDENVTEILSHHEGIRPPTLCFDGANSCLLMSGYESDTVHVLHLSQ